MELVSKQCVECGETKPLGEFPTSKPRPGEVYSQGRCKPCQNAWNRRKRKHEDYLAQRRIYNAQYRREHRERMSELGKFAGRRQRHGISAEQIWKMLDDQGFTCGICGEGLGLPTEPRAFAVDHDHNTGKVRMLLCDRCNMGLGYFQDDPARLEAARKYATHFNSLR